MPSLNPIQQLNVGEALGGASGAGVMQTDSNGLVLDPAPVALSSLASLADQGVIGRAADSAGAAALLSPTADGQILKRASGSVGFSALAATDVPDGLLTLAKLSDLANATVIGRNTSGTGVPEAVTMAQLAALMRLSPLNIGLQSEASSLNQFLGNATANGDYSILVLGDSTGDSSTEWVRLWADAIASEYSSTHRVEYSTYDSSTFRFSAPTVVTAGPSGECRVDVAASNPNGLIAAAAIGVPAAGEDLSVRVKLSAADWTPASRRGICGHWASATNQRSWALLLNTNGTIALWHSSDGTNNTFVNSTASVAFLDGATGWVRADLDVDNGASGRTTTFYTSTDGSTWTQLGAPVVTATAINLHPSTGDAALGTINAEAWNGSIYGVQVFYANNMAWPPGLSAFQWDLPLAGSPTLRVFNASVSGWNISNFIASAHINNTMLRLGRGLAIVSLGHNQVTNTGRVWLSATGGARGSVAEMLTAIRARTLAPIVWIAQNPQQPAAQYSTMHGARVAQLAGYARYNGFGIVDVFSAFIAVADWEATLMADTVHPNAAGQLVWLAAVREALI